MRIPTPIPLTRSLLAGAGAIFAALTLAACGGSNSPTNAAASERAQEQKAETRFADFAKCLREHGVNAESISHPGGGHGLKISPGAAHSPQAFEAAQMACKRYQPEPKQVNLSPQQKAEAEEGLQKFAKCMRERGIKVETSAKGGGVQVGIHVRAGEANAPNPESPAFRRAQSTCQKLLPKPPGGGGREGGPFPAGGGHEGGAGLATGGGK